MPQNPADYVSMWDPFVLRAPGTGAGLEIKTTLHQMLRRYRWSVPARYALSYQRLPIGKPRDGLALRIERL